MTPQTLAFNCQNCGADLVYEPGTTVLKCEYCGTENSIETEPTLVEELDYLEHLQLASKNGEQLEMNMAHCSECGATSSLPDEVTADLCPYCATPLVIDDVGKEHFLKPQYVLPFQLNEQEARKAFRDWLNGLWFVPGGLKKNTRELAKFKGIYLPFWTYDSDTYTKYRGERGDHYWEDEDYRTYENGEWVTKTRRVRKTRWYSASGSVQNFFNDVLILASESLSRSYISKLEPWDLQRLVSFKPEYLSGFTTEKYRVDLEDGFQVAKEEMRPRIKQLIRKDIGGDEQRIHSMDTSYSDITFKHILLPTYLSNFRYKDKLYHFVVNARTGEVQGERPWSYSKIIILVLTLVLIAIIVVLVAGQQ